MDPQASPDLKRENHPHSSEHEHGSQGRLDVEQQVTSGSGITDDDRTAAARGRTVDQMEQGYWKSWRFLGSMLAIGLGFAGGTGGFALIAPVLSTINNELGPSPNILWCSLVYLLMEAVFFLLVGKISDIFGRRWFFIFGSFLSLIGCIIGATAQTVNTLIGAEVLIGLASAFQISFFWAISEIVPMKWRYIANSFCYIMTLPTNPLAPKVALAFQQTAVRWRGSFYFMIALNALSVICWYLFYHPPTFKMLHRKRLAADLLKNFDWLGLLLCSGGLTLVILGLQWGGQLYPWESSEVLTTLIVGGVLLFFVAPFYEVWVSRRGKDPYLPVHLFRNMPYMSVAWLTAIGNGIYYGFSIVWPQAVANIYLYQGDGLSYERFSTLTGLVPLCFVLGQIVGTVICTFTGPKPGIIFTVSVGSPLLCAAAANPLNMYLTMGLIASGALLTGMMEGMAICTSTFPIRDQKDIGEAGGLSGTIRAFGSVVAVAVYSAVLSNRLETTIPQFLYPAVQQAGLPQSSLAALVAGLGGSGPLDASAVPGLTDAILAVARTGYAEASAAAFSTVFYTSFAFGGIGMILAWFVAQNDKNKESFVAGHIHTREQGKTVGEKTASDGNVTP